MATNLRKTLIMAIKTMTAWRQDDMSCSAGHHPGTPERNQKHYEDIILFTFNLCLIIIDEKLLKCKYFRLCVLKMLISK